MLDLALRDLEYVVAVESERNFSRAAERLHMAQPALSQAVIRIERRIGVELFVRTSRQVVPTEAGALFVREAAEILDRVELAVQRTRQLGERSRAVHVHVSEPSLETPRRLLAAVRGRHPDLAVHQTTLPHAQVIEELRRGTLNLSIGDRVTGDEIASELVRREPVGVLMTQDHPLAASATVAHEDLAAYPVVSIDSRLSGWNGWVERLLAQHELAPTWTASTAYGAAPGSDLVADGRALMVCVESVGKRSVTPNTWRPLSPQRDVGWFLSWLDTPPPVQQAIDAIQDFVRERAWAKPRAQDS